MYFKIDNTVIEIIKEAPVAPIKDKTNLKRNW